MAQQPFSLDGDRYDSSSYFGRVKNAYEVSDMSTVFASQKDIDGALKLLDDFKNGNLEKNVTDDQLWKARKLKNAVFHPDTGEKIILPFRMSFFVPANILVVSAMLQARSVPATVFWQFTNQTYNVCLNHANRNASNEMSAKQLAMAYVGAVGSSVGTAVGLNEWVKRTPRFSEATRTSLLRFIPFTAVAIANMCNISLMRWNEMHLGVSMKGEDGHDYGSSAIAGRRGIAQTIVTRIAMTMPGMVIPPVVMARFETTALFKQRPWLWTPVNLAILGTIMYGAMPLCLGAVPQRSEIDVQKLEKKFQGLKDENGKPIQHLYFNKGL